MAFAQPQGSTCLPRLPGLILTHTQTMSYTSAHHSVPTTELNLLLWSSAQGAAQKPGHMPRHHRAILNTLPSTMARLSSLCLLGLSYLVRVDPV